MIHEVEYLQRLSEEELRNIVIIPLLKQMGLRDVITYHGGSSEKGKDIIGYYPGPLEDRHYVAVVAKRGDIHGAVSKSGSACEVLFQVEQALNEPYTDIYDLKELRFDECWIITSGEIKNTAIESIRGKLAKTNLDKLVRFIDRTRLIGLIAIHMPGFWHRDRHILRFVHEIRHPLVSIRANTDLLRQHADSMTAEKRERRLAAIELDTQMCLRLVESLAFAQKTDVEPRLQRFDGARMLDSLLDSVSPADRVRIKLRPENLRHGPMILGDQGLLKHAVRSVIENAIVYSHGDVAVEATVNAREGVTFTVTDSGIGIPAGAEERIFDFGYRAENAQAASVHGMGMGLAVARRILRQHHGDVRLSNPANPTVFSLSLPQS